LPVFLNVWQKFEVLHDLMLRHPQINYFLWIDSDAYIVNVNHRIADFIIDDKDFLVTHDHNGLNIGIFIIKNSAWGLDLMKTMMHLNQSAYEHEQAALDIYFKKNPKDVLERVRVLPQCAFNSYPGWYGWHNSFQRSDFIAHFAGQPQKFELLEKLIKGTTS
jgi:hypothetical protein